MWLPSLLTGPNFLAGGRRSPHQQERSFVRSEKPQNRNLTNGCYAVWASIHLSSLTNLRELVELGVPILFAPDKFCDPVKRNWAPLFIKRSEWSNNNQSGYSGINFGKTPCALKKDQCGQQFLRVVDLLNYEADPHDCLALRWLPT